MKLKLNKIQIRQFVILFVSVFLLFLITYKNFQIRQLNRINNVSSINTINQKEVNPKQLFNESWQIIKSNYYSKNLNKQNWSRWKRRYANKIKTKDDAYVAINTMLASLNDPYSRFLSEEEFQEQNSAINSKLYGIEAEI